MDEYKRQQMEAEERDWPAYYHAPTNFSPAQRFYGYVEHSTAVRLLEEAGVRAIDRALVCGVGGGNDLQYWLSHLPIRRCVGLDFAVNGLRAAQRRLHHDGVVGTVDWVRGDIEALPLADEAVDVVFVAHAMHHLPDPRRGFRELFRVCRKAMVVIEPAQTPLMPLFVRLGIARHVEDDGNVVQRFDRESLAGYLAGEDFSLRAETRLYPYHPFVANRVIRLFDLPGGLPLLRGLHRWTETLLPFLRSKLVAVVTKPVR
jgi:SAM-dependent methyltransferase